MKKTDGLENGSGSGWGRVWIIPLARGRRLEAQYRRTEARRLRRMGLAPEWKAGRGIRPDPDPPLPGRVSGAGVALDLHYRVPQLAELWGFSDRTIIKLFENEPGVIRLGTEGRNRRAYRTLSVPESVALRVHQRLSNQQFKTAFPPRGPLRIIRLRDLDRGMTQKPRNILKLKSR